MTIRANDIHTLREDKGGAPATVVVYGATGHTGRFVVAELRRRGLPVIAAGRNPERLDTLDGVQTRVAALDDPVMLHRALSGATVVINCAGPFLDTAQPIIEAALRRGASYLDVTAEQQAARDTFGNYDEVARQAGVKIIPAAGFFGGLADLLVRAAIQGWHRADHVRIGVALDGWQPTQGTRSTGQRNNVQRVTLSDGALVPLSPSVFQSSWDFEAPFDRQDVAAAPLSEIIVIARDPRIANAGSVMNVQPLQELSDSRTPGPLAIDALGRSDQKFMVDVIVENEGRRRRALATGQDIYAVTAPIVVEAAERIFLGRLRTPNNGAFALSELFEPRAFLATIAASYPGFQTRFSFNEAEND